MKQQLTPLADQYLQSLQGMKEPETDHFFYTRLKVRMEKQQQPTGWSFPVKPVWVIGVLVLMLAINGVLLSKQFKSRQTDKTVSPTLQSFAESYDQTLSPY